VNGVNLVYEAKSHFKRVIITPTVYPLVKHNLGYVGYM
jgi:hypothetical protein